MIGGAKMVDNLYFFNDDQFGYPGHQRTKIDDISKFGMPAKLRSSSWWIRYFVQTSLEENEAAIKKFEQATLKRSYKPSCQIFHLKSYQ